MAPIFVPRIASEDDISYFVVDTDLVLQQQEKILKDQIGPGTTSSTKKSYVDSPPISPKTVHKFEEKHEK